MRRFSENLPSNKKIVAMRSLILLPAIALISFSFRPSAHFHARQTIADTTIINHVLDANIDEWPAEKFEQDNETNIKYAIDNDAQNLYVAMVIPGFPTQMKMMRQGMDLYIDLKGKKKQGRGIEFPVTKDRSSFGGGNFSSGTRTQQDKNESNTERQKPDMKEMRGMMALNLLSMKLFGFSDEAEPKEQGLIMPGSVNIQFNWDDSNVMFVEYNIPLNLLGDKETLSQKNISLGWKLKAMEMPSGNVVSSTTTMQGRQSGGSRGFSSSRPSGAGGPSQQGMESMTKEQSFWAKYTISFPANY